MHFLDIFIFLSLAASFFFGWKLRAISLFGMALSLITGIWVGNHFYPRLLGLYTDLPSPVALSLAWITAFLATAITLTILFNMISKLFEAIHLKWLDHLLGAALAVSLMTGLLIIGLTITDTISKKHEWKLIEKATIAPYLLLKTRPFIEKNLNQFPSWKQKN